MPDNETPRPAQSEEVRLAAIARYEILDTPPEATFTRVLDILKAVLDVAVTAITLVDVDRSYYLALAGADEPPTTVREDNMCDTVITQDDVLVISDSHSAPEGLSRRMLKAGLRFYAGAPLRTHDGIKIGTVCAIDPMPRKVTEGERQILRDLSAIVIDEMELRLAARQMAVADAELRRLNQELEVTSRNKSEFLASMSHELRTPLNGILGASELLVQGLFGDLNPKQREYIEDVHASGEHLLRLIEDVLDLSRIEAGQTELRREPIDAGDLMHGCEAIVRGLAESKAVRLDVQSPDPPVLLYVDERRIAQVACNLLSNALKFTPHAGRVVFRAQRQGDEAVFSVTDQGPGIPSQYSERIFEQFFRVPSDQEGTGLGLALARQLVELHGGRVWLDNGQAGGCCFSFALPLRDRIG